MLLDPEGLEEFEVTRFVRAVALGHVADRLYEEACDAVGMPFPEGGSPLLALALASSELGAIA